MCRFVLHHQSLLQDGLVLFCELNTSQTMIRNLLFSNELINHDQSICFLGLGRESSLCFYRSFFPNCNESPHSGRYISEDVVDWFLTERHWVLMLVVHFCIRCIRGILTCRIAASLEPYLCSQHNRSIQRFQLFLTTSFC